MMEVVQVTGSMVEISGMHQQTHDVSFMVGPVDLPSLGKLPGGSATRSCPSIQHWLSLMS